jgi:uncharacterized FlaG/YvyC family protein
MESLDSLVNEISSHQLPVGVSKKSVPQKAIERTEFELSIPSDKSEVMRKIVGVDINISLDDDSFPPVVRIMDKASGKEIVQIPTDASIAIQKSVDRLIGLIFDQKT